MNESGKMTRSAEEWEMSLSCQRGMFSRATWRFARTMPGEARRSARSGPGSSCGASTRSPSVPRVNGSSTSRTSVLWRCRISRANFSSEVAVEGQGGHDLGVPVPLEDLGRDLGRAELELPEGERLDPGIQVDVGADRSRDAADRDDVDGPLHPFDMPADLLDPDEDLEPEGHRLGVDAVGPADAGRLLVLEGLALQDLLERPELEPGPSPGIPGRGGERAVSTTS